MFLALLPPFIAPRRWCHIRLRPFFLRGFSASHTRSTPLYTFVCVSVWCAGMIREWRDRREEKKRKFEINLQEFANHWFISKFGRFNKLWWTNSEETWNSFSKNLNPLNSSFSNRYFLIWNYKILEKSSQRSLCLRLLLKVILSSSFLVLFFFAKITDADFLRQLNAFLVNFARFKPSDEIG